MKSLAPLTLPIVLGVLLSLPANAAAQLVDEAHRQQALQRYRAGQELLFSEQFEKAEQEFAAAIQLDPLLTVAHYGRGQAFMALKRYTSAVQAFIKCREAYQTLFGLRQSDVVAMDRRADQEIRELKDTISALQSGRVKSMGGSAGTVDSRIAQLEARIRDLQRLRQADTGRFEAPAEVSLALGSAYYRSGSAADAEREWKAAIEANPKLGEAHNNLAVLYLQTGRPGEAEEALKNAKKAGFRVNPQLEKDIKKAKGA
jgi:tetratricopeptide (TPR) repeat protein